MSQKTQVKIQITQPPQEKKLLEQVQDAIRTKHYSYRTEQTYKDWIKRYTLRVYHRKRHPMDMTVKSPLNT